MHLSRLRLVGFKSFPQGVELSFEPGITAIVGPNGCGKSNIADAIRWVLGEQGHRILRAERMEDVIFHGNGTSQAQGMAEVSLTISGHQAQLPTEFSEINITRRLFRSGESQYLLNGAPCLLRDILNLFFDSGLGNTPYALIEQGSVASLLDSRAWEKKAMIEEAAGIMKYRVRRKAAVAKLEAAAQNLLRLQDIIREVEQQRNSLSRQAKKAREYEEARKRIEYLEGYLRVRDYEGAEIKLSRIAAALKERADERLSLAARIGQYESQLERERLHLLSLDGTFRETQQSVIRIQGEREKAKAQGEILTQEKEELTKREEKAQAHLVTLASQLAELQGAMSEGRGAIDSVRERVGSLSRTEEELLRATEDLSKEVARLGQSLEEKRREAIRAAALCSNLRNQRAALEKQSLKLNQQTRKIEAQQGARSSEQAELQDRLKGLEEKLQELARGFAELRSRQTQLTDDLASTLEEEKGSDAASSKLQRQVDELSSRLSSYQELQRTYSDYGEGARYLLQNRNASPPALSRPALLMAIGELLETQAGYERAIESLLGSELKGLVLKDVEEIHRIIQETEVLQKGGATFLPLSFFSDSAESKFPPAPSRPLASFPGILGRAIDFIRVEPQYQDLMRRLLDDSLVVEDLEVAMKVCRQPGRPRAIATLKGEVITSRGAIRLASDSISGLLVRQREMKDLSKKLWEAKEELEKAQTKREALGQHRRRLQESSESLATEEQILQIERVALEKDRSQVAMELKRADQQIEFLALEKASLEEENAQLEAELLSLAEEEREQESRQQRVEEETRDLQTSLESLRGQQRPIWERRESTAQELRLQEETKREREMHLARLEEQISSLLQGREQTGKELAAIRERRFRIEESLQEKEKILRDLSSQESEASAASKEIGKQREEKSSSVDKIQEEIGRLKRHSLEIDGALNHLQIERAQIEQDLVHLREGLTRSGVSGLAQARELYQEEGREVPQVEEELVRLKERCQRLEPVNMAALVDYEAFTKRYLFLRAQAEDLSSSAASLRQTISEIDKTTERLFGQAIGSINQHFREYCAALFGGGSAQIRLQNGRESSEGAEEAGVEIMVSLPGKHLAHLSLLSGGEKALAGLAFLMALFKYRPSPFCFLDEVDAPLDDANLERFLSLLGDLSQRHQFILITHNKKTMEAADCLYGVTMEEPGISKVVSVRWEGSRDR